MQSVLLEYFRFDDLNTGVLAGGKRYLLTHKNLAVKEVTTTTNHVELLKKLRECFRYQSSVSHQEQWKTIRQISSEVQAIFLDLSQFKYTNCQLDVVLNASELGLLPFELLLDEHDVPYFTNPEKSLVFTRRLRHDFLEAQVSLPYTPRVLFAYSHGGFTEVPYEAHLYELDKALNKWYGKERGKIIQVLANPTFEAFAEVIQQNDTQGTPFTHIHLLGHGNLIFDPGMPEEYEYGIVFGLDKGKTTPTQLIKQLFESVQNKPFLVNYLICDGGNFSNAMKPDKNPVQVTHKAGVPIVLGSQYPLSMDGSTLITKMLYASLFIGKDIRTILHGIRAALFRRKEENHDWISLVAYVRLPEGYDDYLYEVSLRWHMQQLKAIKSATDGLLAQIKPREDDFISHMAELKECIVSLEKKLNEIEGNAKYEKEYLENLGLLGSAYKRLAELHFIMQTKFGSAEGVDSETQKSLLLKALQYYKKACDKNLSHHWSLVQYLSLALVLEGSIADMDYWYTARKAIENAIACQPDVWAYGSMLELLLLHTGNETCKQQCLDTLSKFIETAGATKDVFSLESTWLQLDRYKSWWTAKNGFEINGGTLVTDTAFLNTILKELETVIPIKVSS